ncbi:hypothetical protein L798_11457 [Zootermopsis nevadensis]|uniref:Uncharacterized protein n=1 Tax=Zootermopsis nevadensis TaxID=136037 RepID=A0A067QWX3_ZOONE|nr:hypothetical protein L798_11457 [Zootermopsis nevadensis]
MYGECLHMFTLEHKSCCVDDVCYCHCHHFQTLHNSAVAVVHGNCDYDDGDGGDDVDCDPAAAAVVPHLKGLLVLPAHKDSHLTVMWMVAPLTPLVYLFLELHLHHSPQQHS